MMSNEKHLTKENTCSVPWRKRTIVVICFLWAWVGYFPIDAFGQHTDTLPITQSPNILLIIADDLGYSDIGAFGGEIHTPILDKLATLGIKFTNFHTLPTCSPTRSVLLTGTDNHIAGVGGQAPVGVTEYQQQHPGYEGYLNHRVATLPAVLQNAGYQTYHVGKWHLGEETGLKPSDRGFKESFTLLQGGASHYADQKAINPHEGVTYARNGQIIKQLPSDFYSTKNYTDSVLTWMERDKENGQPFFAHLAYTAPHDPLQAPKSYIEKYKGQYDEGYEVLREKRFQQLKTLGLIPATHQLPPFPKTINRWADLSPEEQKNKSRDMETYAAMIDYLDEQIGRIIQWLEVNEELENTFIVFISDNGANGMGTHVYQGFTPEWATQFDNSFENRGMPNSYTNQGAGWATASTAAFRLLKAFSTEGGIRTPMIIKPSKRLGIAKSSWINHSFIHVKDLMPTFLDLANATHPSATNSELAKMSGQSLLPILDKEKADLHLKEGIGYELHGTRAYFKDKWKLLQMPLPLGGGDWQLYNLEEDIAETNNLALTYPEKVAELKAAYFDYERNNGVIYDLPGSLSRFKKYFQFLMGFLALIFGLAILGKLSGKLTEQYQKWNYGKGFMYGLAGIESIGLAGLFTPYYKYAAYLLLVIMLGAFFTIIKNKENWEAYIMPLSATLLLGLLLFFKSGRMVAAFF